MKQGNSDTKELLKEFDETESEFIQVVSSFSQEQLNESPFEGSWTAAQVAEHMLKSKSGIPQLFLGATKLTERRPDENIEAMKSMFMNFDTKLKSPDFILPSDKPHDKETLLTSLQNTKAAISKVAGSVDLSETCTSFSFPGIGELTRLEWMNFLVCHTKRHTHQLINIFKAVTERQDVSDVK